MPIYEIFSSHFRSPERPARVRQAERRLVELPNAVRRDIGLAEIQGLRASAANLGFNWVFRA
jgi:hypothetical protein